MMDSTWGVDDLAAAASLGDPKAMYAYGVRLKHGFFVPKPTDWQGPGGNVFAQPVEGQRWIDQALAAGFRPTCSEYEFLLKEFR